ncbi:MAG: SURF1 family protein [Alphaproteobacteria bacterium]
MMSRRLLWTALAGLPVLIILLGLGTWQAQRLAWKNDVLARIAAAEGAPPAPFSDPPVPYAKLEVLGRFDHGREALLGVEIRANRRGARLVVPFLRDSGPPVLVDRGWVPIDGLAGLPRPEGPQRIMGYVRFGEPAGRFAAQNDVAGRRFYHYDPAAIGAALGVPGMAPYGLVLLGQPGSLPEPAQILPRPRNNHLGYAITWYGLALSLVGVFVAFAWRGRKRAGMTRGS